MGLFVDVSVGVDVEIAVTVKLLVGTTVGVSGSGVKVNAGVVGGRMEGVDVPGTGGLEIKVDRNASRIRTPIMIGMAYLRSISGKPATGLVGGSPVYSNAASRFLRLST